MVRPSVKPTPPPAPKPISLALQGGGAHGAFQWGVIDRLLEDGRVEIKAVTGASAGAMNGVVLAAGLLDGGPEGGRARLDAFWRAVNQTGGRNAFGDVSIWNALFNPDWLKATPGWQMAQSWAAGFSPYQFNPLNLNPLRDALDEVVDFAAIRARSPIALYVSATAVHTSDSRIFRTHELTVRSHPGLGVPAAAVPGGRDRRRTLLGRRLPGQSGALAAVLRSDAAGHPDRQSEPLRAEGDAEDAGRHPRPG